MLMLVDLERAASLVSESEKGEIGASFDIVCGVLRRIADLRSSMGS